MKRLISLFLAALLLFSLAACNVAPSDEGETAAYAYLTEEELPLSDFIVSLAVPDFLTAEQQLLYRQAYALHLAMFGGETTGIDMSFPAPSGGETQVELYRPEGSDFTYSSSTGRFAKWEDFDRTIHAVFTDALWQQENSTPVYLEHDGALYILDASYGDQTYNELFPDEFALIEETSERIAFTVTAHYSYPWPREDESYAQRDERLQTSYEYTVTYPVTLILTESGWRFDEFNTANSADMRVVGTWDGISEVDFYADAA